MPRLVNLCIPCKGSHIFHRPHYAVTSRAACSLSTHRRRAVLVADATAVWGKLQPLLRALPASRAAAPFIAGTGGPRSTSPDGPSARKCLPVPSSTFKYLPPAGRPVVW